MQKFIQIALVIFALLIFAPQAQAEEVSSSASLKAHKFENPEIDYRNQILSTFLKKKNSPLSEEANTFITKADENGLDWRLIPAISGLESSYGKRIPPSSYNAYGWANGKYQFDSWEDSIETVAITLNTKYMDRGLVTVSQIGAVYAPPSNTWSSKVSYIMKDIDPYRVDFDL